MSNIKLVHSGGNSVSLTTPTNNPSSNVTFKLPAADGTAGQVLQTDGNGNLTWVTLPSQGLPMVEQWELSDEVIVSSAQTYMMTGTWAKRNQNGSGTIGASGMSVSSGVFTFPSTGVYHILLHCDCRNSFGTGRRRVQGIINTTHDNSTYIEAVKGGGNLSNRGSTTTVSNNTALIFDVQNVSNYKVKFSINWSNEGRINARSSNSTATNVIFMKLGDT